MDLENFLAELKTKGVELWIEGDKLRYRAAEDALTSTELDKLKQAKQDVLNFLRQGSYIGKTYPLSCGQEALYFIHELAPKSFAYNTCSVMRVYSEVDTKALRQALQALIERHAGLRTLFSRDANNSFIQNVYGYRDVYFEKIDASGWDEAELKKQVRAAYIKPFNLNQGSLFRARLFSRSKKDHVLLLTIHHIVFDAWSSWVITDELERLYIAQKTGIKAELEPIKSSYADFVRWQAEFLNSSKAEELENYWKKQLAGELPALNLPTDYPRPPIQTFNGATYTFELNQELSAQLKSLAEAERVTVFMLLMAAYQTLLRGYTGQENILTGIPIAHRSQKKAVNILGYFVNILIIRADFSTDLTFQNLLDQTRQTLLDAVKYQDYPFPLLLQKLRLKRDLSRSPLAQTNFNLQTPQKFKEFTELIAGKRIKWAGWEIEAFELNQQEGQNDLQLEMIDVGKKFFAAFKYNTDLFKLETIQRMAGHFQTLLEGIVSDPHRRISELPLLTEAERHKILVEWNDTAADYPKDKRVHQLFEEQAAKTPDNPAVVFEDRSLTYAELSAKANQLARYLQSLGVGPEILVGICVERSLEMIVGLLGIMKAGGAYVPLDPAYPSERLAYMLEDADVPVLLTQSALLDALPESQAKTVCLDADWETIGKENVENATGGAKADNLAYVLYTSGSTGRPKGVAIEHRGVTALICWAGSVYNLSELSGTLASTSICFDLSVYEIFCTLSVGGKMILVSNALELANLSDKESVTLINTVPSAMEELLRLKAIPDSVQTVNLAGEPLLPSLADRIYESASVKKVYDLFGPSEDTVYSTFALRRKGGPKTIGRPISNTQVYILDVRLNPVPVGVPGELYIGGAGLARGYLNKPELTAEKFIPNPFGKEPGSRLYKTGDLAQYLPDGSIEFLGRMDHQVKIRGFRVELGEIETMLLDNPDIKEAVVTAGQDETRNKYLRAYIVSDQKPTLSELREYLSQKLPDYMIPSHFALIDKIPLTPSGKIDRKALPDMVSNIDTGVVYVAPRSEIEKILVEIWSEVLGIEKIGIKDNFFDLGGNSFDIINIVLKAEQFGVKINVRQVYKAPIIEKLAKSAKTTSSKISPVHNEEDTSVIENIRIAPTQKFILDFINNGYFVTPIYCELRKPIQFALLKKALRRLVVQHDMLRARFVNKGDAWTQECLPIDELDMAELCVLKNLSGLSLEEMSAAAGLTSTETHENINIENSPLARVVLYDFGDKRPQTLLFSIHHLVSDGVSSKILLNDLENIYGQLEEGKTVNLAPTKTSYKRWVDTIYDYLENSNLKDEADFWVAQLKSRSLKTDFNKGPRLVKFEELFVEKLGIEQTARLHEIVLKNNIPMSDILLSAFMSAIKSVYQQDSLSLSLLSHGRHPFEQGQDISETTGCFMTHYPIRLELKEENPQEAVESLQKQLSRVPNNGAGYAVLKYLDSSPRLEEFRSLPEPNVTFNYIGEIQTDKSLNKRFALSEKLHEVGKAKDPEGKWPYVLTARLLLLNKDLVFAISYNTNYLKRETIDNLMGTYLALLEEWIQKWR